MRDSIVWLTAAVMVVLISVAEAEFQPGPMRLQVVRTATHDLDCVTGQLPQEGAGFASCWRPKLDRRSAPDGTGNSHRP